VKKTERQKRRFASTGRSNDEDTPIGDESADDVVCDGFNRKRRRITCR